MFPSRIDVFSLKICVSNSSSVNNLLKTVIRKFAERFDLTGVFTHLCVADSTKKEDVDFTVEQLKSFSNIVASLSDLNIKYVHCLNSAGGLYYNKSSYTIGHLIRAGIVLYGLKPNIKNALPYGIEPIMTWKTVVAMVKNVRSGESVGYGRTFFATKDMRIATLPIGYADGYNRRLSNKGYVLIRGRRAPVIGNICMDQMMVDITNIPDAQMSDEVTLIGRDGDEVITADEIAEMIGTIGYEIVCTISNRVDSVIVEEI